MKTVLKISDTFGGPSNNTNNNLSVSTNRTASTVSLSPTTRKQQQQHTASQNITTTMDNRKSTISPSSPSPSPQQQHRGTMQITSSSITNNNKNTTTNFKNNNALVAGPNSSSSPILSATNASTIMGDNLRVLQELQLVDEYALFHELYHYMGALYQVMKTTVGASANVVGASAPMNNNNPTTSPSHSPLRMSMSVKNSGGPTNLSLFSSSAAGTGRDVSSMNNRSGNNHRSESLAIPSSAANGNQQQQPTRTSTSILDVVRQSFSQNNRSNNNNNSNNTNKENNNTSGLRNTILVASSPLKKQQQIGGGERSDAGSVVDGRESTIGGGGGGSDEDDDDENEEEEPRNVGKHYYLVLPKDEALQSLISIRSGGSMLPTFASSPEQRRRERKSGSHLRVSTATAGGVGDNDDPSQPQSPITARIRHNVVRCHLFQGEQRVTIRRRKRNHNSTTTMMSNSMKRRSSQMPHVNGARSSVDLSSGHFTSSSPSEYRPMSPPPAAAASPNVIALTGLSGLNGSIAFHINNEEEEKNAPSPGFDSPVKKGLTTPIDASTAPSETAENNSKTEGTNICAGSDSNKEQQKFIATVTISPVSMPLSSTSATINTTINISGFNTIGNLTILYSDKAVVQQADQYGRNNNNNASMASRDQSTAAANNNGSFSSNNNANNNANNNSQMWWQRVPIAVTTSQMPKECDPKPIACPMAAATAMQAEDDLRDLIEKKRAEGVAEADLPKILPSDARQTIYNYFPEPQIASLFKQDEQRLIAVLQHELEAKGFPVDEILTSLDTEVAMFNSAYVCMKGFEGFIVSKVQNIVEGAQESIFAYFQQHVNLAAAASSNGNNTLSSPPLSPTLKASSFSRDNTGGPNGDAAVDSSRDIHSTTAAASSSVPQHQQNASVDGNLLPHLLDCSPPQNLNRHSSSNQLLASGAATRQQLAASTNSIRSVGGGGMGLGAFDGDVEAYYRSIISDDDEEQISAVLHVIVTSGIALKLNSHWSSVFSVEDYAFHHACVSLRKTIDKRLPEFLPDICIGKANIDSFANAIRICRYIDSPDATMFSIMRAMEAAVTSIVTIVTDCCDPGKTHEVTADVCIPMVVLVLILAGLQSLPSKIKLILELIVPVLELSSLGYAMTTFEASAEQIHHEYAQMVANRE